MKTELFIGLRYLFTRRKEKFISLISVISVLGVAIGVTALIVVIGVMSGFDEDLRDKILGNYAHITLTADEPMVPEEYEPLLRQIGLHPGVAGLSPYVQGQVLMKHAGRYFAVGLKGIDPARESRVTKIASYMKEGTLDGLGPDEIIVGKELSAFLDLAVGSALSVYSPLGKEYTLVVSGIFASGMYDYDMNLVYSNLATAQSLFGLQGNLSSIGIKIKDLSAAGGVRSDLAELLGYRYSLRTWMEVNQNFFAALELEKLTMFIILTLIILVASFNIVSTLIVTVVNKTKDIGVLKALGMPPAGIRGIFMLEGIFIGTFGVALGCCGGLVLCGLLKKYQFIKLPQDIYYIDRLPVSIQVWPDIAFIVAAAMAIVVAATVYPAHKAAQLKPVEALRYE
jgi:lipoprotein-releasing system permease protein